MTNKSLEQIKLKLNSDSISENLFDAFINSGKEEVVIINIGTDKNIGDSFGPMIGTFLKENNAYINVYGTLENPIHANNLNVEVSKIYKQHPNSFVIATDACLGETEDIENIYLRNKPILPGLGVGKKLMSVGDYSIVGIVNEKSEFDFLSLQSIRLSMIYKMTNKVTKKLLEFDELIKDYFESNCKEKMVN